MAALLITAGNASQDATYVLDGIARKPKDFARLAPAVPHICDSPEDLVLFCGAGERYSVVACGELNTGFAEIEY